MEDFEEIKLESQMHPMLTASTPFDILVEYGRGPQEHLKGDVHYALQLSIVLCGAVEAAFGDWSRIFRKNELWWTMCWEPHAFRLVARHNMVMTVNINIDNLGSVGPCSNADWLAPFIVPPSRRYCPSTDEEHLEIRTIVRSLFRLESRKPLNWQTHCWLLIHQLILRASENIQKEPGNNAMLNADMSRIQRAVSLVRTRNIPPSLREAAAECSLSVSRFSVLFSSAMGVSYGQFALRVRLSNAANDVKTGLFTLNEIAEKHGFCDASSFCNAFKKLYRCTPNEFKLRH